MLLMHHADHLVTAILSAVHAVIAVAEARRNQAQRPTPLPYKVSRRKQGDRGLLADLRNDSDFCTALLKIEDGSAGSPWEKNDSFGCNSTILRPRPALARKAAGSNKVGIARLTFGPPFS